ncbi:hypothetical protein N0V82_003323 [Gnomoniopsis sp. IMI 355080]|nr:hypothetical protein N0V82_003323 [Gnomoniopsis sp. IMI 355080]
MANANDLVLRGNCRNYWEDTVPKLKATHDLRSLPHSIDNRSFLKHDYITYQALFDMGVPATHYHAMFSSVRPVVGTTKTDMLAWADRHLHLKASGCKADILEQVIRATWERDFGQNSAESSQAKQQKNNPQAQTDPDLPLTTGTGIIIPESSLKTSPTGDQIAISSTDTQNSGSQSVKLSTAASSKSPSGPSGDQVRRPKADFVEDNLAARLAAMTMSIIVKEVVDKTSPKKFVNSSGHGMSELDARAVKALEGIDASLRLIADLLHPNLVSTILNRRLLSIFNFTLTYDGNRARRDGT